MSTESNKCCEKCWKIQDYPVDFEPRYDCENAICKCHQPSEEQCKHNFSIAMVGCDEQCVKCQCKRHSFEMWPDAKCPLNVKPTQSGWDWEAEAVGKNVHSVYTLCLNCHTWGIGMPLDKVCGNCGKDTETLTYYDAETISKILASREKQLKEMARGLLKDEQPMENGVPVETYGYEAEYNNGIRAVISKLKG